MQSAGRGLPVSQKISLQSAARLPAFGGERNVIRKKFSSPSQKYKRIANSLVIDYQCEAVPFEASTKLERSSALLFLVCSDKI